MGRAEPIYDHDCDACRFLGTVSGPRPMYAVANPPQVSSDLWYCKQADSSMGGSVIARHSSEGWNYSSSPIKLLSKDSNPMLLWAYHLLEMEKLCSPT